MDIREFSYILAIVEHGSFTKAANSLYISQPSLSLYIKNMWRDVWALRFFNRTNRKAGFDGRRSCICGIRPENHGT
ncbi:MAG: LysR family transcriptional regulator [Enterocloster sp.]